MTTVGIIANPASGKDIRRLVAYGSVFDNNEKVNIVRRVLLGLEAVGVEEVVFMPDSFAIGARAIDGLQCTLTFSFLDFPLLFTQEDSVRAAALMRERGVGCLVTLGGDGTNRAVAKACGAIPLLPISTGTNNVFPVMIEGTLAGLAAGLVAKGAVELARVVRSTRRLEVERNGAFLDIALVDAVVYDDLFVAARAIWEMAKVREIVLTGVEPGRIGLSAIGDALSPLAPVDGAGLYIKTGEGPYEVVAPVAPGLIKRIGVEAVHPLALGERVQISHKPSVLALDGEREIMIGREDQVSLTLSPAGPRVVNVKRVFEEAAKRGLFIGRGKNLGKGVKPASL